MISDTKTMYEAGKQVFLAEVEKYYDACRDLSDWLADHPEVSHKEYNSSKAIVELLKSDGYDVEYPYAGLDTAFRAVFGENNHTYKMAIMTEYDALPEIGHGCGHCVSAAISVLAGLSLRCLQDELDTDIHIVGTPAEEHGGCKSVMIENGGFDGYSAAMSVHLYDRSCLAPVCLALCGNTYTFTGKTAHAAACPWDGRNALNGARLMLDAVDMLRQHVKPDTRIHDIITNGGLTPNTIPDSASVELFVRALDNDYMDHVAGLVADCANGAAMATQTTCEIKPSVRSYMNLKNNEPGLKCLEEVFSELGLPLNDNPSRIFASTDAGNVSYVCPTFHPCLEIAPAGTPLHTKAFEACVRTDTAHAAIKNGAALIGLQALKLFGDKDVLTAVQQDFAKR